jgi:tryptophanyl-tRNA synthetase
MEIVVSGIRPTGNLHLGNYFGAVKNFLRMQDDNNCFFFIADYHSLTTHPTPEDLHGNVRQVLAEYLAAGLDPEKATIYVQSDLPEVAELTLLLSMNAYLGELERTTSFKDKARQQPDNVNAGLLTYPVLMAADIIIHHAAKVPVGKDQGTTRSCGAVRVSQQPASGFCLTHSPALGRPCSRPLSIAVDPGLGPETHGWSGCMFQV